MEMAADDHGAWRHSRHGPSDVRHESDAAAPRAAQLDAGGRIARRHAAVVQAEHEGGRRPTRRWGPRVIDVDILLFGDERVDLPDLVIPHPRIRERDFVVASLEELGVQEGRALVKR